VRHLKTGRSPSEAVLDGGGERAEAGGNCRNGFSVNTVLGDSGEMHIGVPRARYSSFEALLVPKWQKSNQASKTRSSPSTHAA